MDTEKVLETILDLERSRQKEQDLRIESEMLLEGLRALIKAHTKEDIFQAIVGSLRVVFEFEDAFILQCTSKKNMKVVLSTTELFSTTRWSPHSTFKKALRGKPVAVYDTNQVPEWKEQEGSIREKIGSALHIGLLSDNEDTLLVLTHTDARYFNPKHVSNAIRITPFLSQAYLTLELRHALVQRDRFFDLSIDLMAILDHQGHLKQFNDIWQTILGYDTSELQDLNILELIHDDDKEAFGTTMNHIKLSGEKLFAEVRFKKANGDYFWYSCSLATYSDESIFYMTARDVTDRVIIEERLFHESRHDDLTGLSNRRDFMDLASKAFNYSLRYPEYRFSLCYLDLNDFKEINDTYGHDHGDKVLKVFGQCLIQCIRETDKAARLGGDEFALLIDNIASKNEVIHIVERILQKVKTKQAIGNHLTKISASIGIVLSDKKFTTLESMLNATDKAMYQAKSDQCVSYKLL